MISQQLAILFQITNLKKINKLKTSFDFKIQLFYTHLKIPGKPFRTRVAALTTTYLVRFAN